MCCSSLDLEHVFSENVIVSFYVGFIMSELSPSVFYFLFIF
jgi:hypothetical protein